MPSGAQRRLLFRLCACWLMLGATSLAAGRAGAATPRHWAVVVGVGQYGDPKIPATPNASADAERIRDWLSTAGQVPGDRLLFLADGGQARFDPAALQLPDRLAPTRQNLRLALKAWLASRVRSDDAVTFFFAGQATTAEGRRWLLPADVSVADVENAVDAAWVARTLGALPAARVRCWYDTSFAGRGKAWGEPSSKGARELVPGKRGTTWVAAGLQQVAHEADREPLGAFTRALLEALRSLSLIHI